MTPTDRAEPIASDAEIERVARALIVRKFGPQAELMFDPPNEATPEQRAALLARVNEARADARIAIVALRKIAK